MEQLNRIEIRGNVGAVRLQVVGNSRVAKISVATNYVYKGRDGEPVIETTWPSAYYPPIESPYEGNERWRDPVQNADYVEGIFLGYRGVEHFGVKPLYPFGYGLTYSTFEYSDLAPGDLFREVGSHGF